MKTKNLELGPGELGLSVDGICYTIGYSSKEEYNLLKDVATELLALSKDICRIKAQYSVFENIRLDNRQRTLEIGKVTFSPGKIIYGQLKNTESLVVFLCTAGKEIGNVSRKAMSEKDLLRGYVLDVIGSELVEAAADLMQEGIGKDFADGGYKITNRYSPGYCGWDVSEQNELFRLIPDNYCGIKLTDSYLMDPVKSVSGIIGIGRNVKKLPYTCNICDMQDCIYRKKRQL